MEKLVCILLLNSIIAFGQKPGRVDLEFVHKFENELISFDTTYFNDHNEDLRFSTINYFVSNISLIRSDGTEYIYPQDSSYFLVKHSKMDDQRQFSLNDIPPGEYIKLKFVIGVDSLRNTMSIEHRKGALDMGGEGKGMYWIWNSGYIFFKLEGISSLAPERGKNKFSYHIGGYGGYKTRTINSIRTVELPLLKFKIHALETSKMTVSVDLERFFKGDFNLRISETPNIMWGNVSEKVADNYVKAFAIQ